MDPDYYQWCDQFAAAWEDLGLLTTWRYSRINTAAHNAVRTSVSLVASAALDLIGMYQDELRLARTALKICREACRTNLVKPEYKDEPILREAFDITETVLAREVSDGK